MRCAVLCCRVPSDSDLVALHLMNCGIFVIHDGFRRLDQHWVVTNTRALEAPRLLFFTTRCRLITFADQVTAKRCDWDCTSNSKDRLLAFRVDELLELLKICF